MRCFNTEDVIDAMLDPYHGSFNNDGVHFDTSKMFKVFLKTHTEKNQMEVPIFITQSVFGFSSDINNTYVYPISGEEYHIESVGGVVTALKHLINSWGRSLYSVNLKGNVYFGGAGVILDSNYSPLLLTSRVYEKHNNDIIIKKERVYLNPEIFTDSSKEINRTINKKFLPYYLLNQKPEIIIGLPSHLMHCVVSPKKESSKEEHAMEISTLKENRDEIIKSIRDNYVFRGTR